MSGPWVPTGSEYDFGATSGKGPAKKPRARRVWEKITRQKSARHEVHVKDGVGESKTVTSPSAQFGRTQPVLAPEQSAARAPDTAGDEPPSGASSAVPPLHAPVRSPARRRRIVRVSEDVLGATADASHDPTDTGRARTWEPGLSDAEIRRRIGPIMRYDDDT
jgi:hypothetical protein